MFFRQPSEVNKRERMKFITYKVDDGKITGKISFCCQALEVRRQEFYRYLVKKERPW